MRLNRASRTKSASANQLDDAGNRIYRPAGRTGMRDPLRLSSAVPTLSMRLPATEYVASLAWFSESALVRLALIAVPSWSG